MAKFPDYQIRRIDSLIPYARNSRTHSSEQVAQIAASITEFGFTNPVLVDAKGNVIAGHGRLQAARLLGMTEVPCVDLSHLSATQRKAYIIADNKLALNAGWDEELLRLEFEELTDLGFDLELTGFNLDEINAMTHEPEFEPATEGEQGKLDKLEPKCVLCPHCGEEFDLREQA